MAATDTTRSQDDLSVAELLAFFGTGALAPERTVENVKRDVDELKEGRHR